MILRNATILYKGYDPLTLSKSSHKRVCVSCDQCGRIRYIEFRTYTNFCGSCANIKTLKNNNIRKKISQSKIGISRSEETKQKISNSLSGLNHWNYGKYLSDETKAKQSKSHRNKKLSDVHKQNISKSRTGKYKGSNNPNWKGGYIRNRSHLLSEIQCLKINKRFLNSEGHHISADVIVYIPKYLHKHINHNLKDCENMDKINLLSLQFIKGEL